MSYEGYEQHLCKNGHRFDIDAYWFGYDQIPTCDICGELSVFCNSIDDTNGEEYGIILEDGWKTLLIEKEKTETCSQCQHTEVIEPAKYRVPTEEQLKKIRHYRPDWDGEYKVLEEWVEVVPHTEDK